MSAARDITELQRLLLGELGFWKDTRTTYLAAALADQVKRSPQKVAAALLSLENGGYVRYFPSDGKGHAGLWQITREGREKIA